MENTDFHRLITLEKKQFWWAKVETFWTKGQFLSFWNCEAKMKLKKKYFMRIYFDKFSIKRFGIYHLGPIVLQSGCAGTIRKGMGKNCLSIFFANLWIDEKNIWVLIEKWIHSSADRTFLHHLHVWLLKFWLIILLFIINNFSGPDCTFFGITSEHIQPQVVATRGLSQLLRLGSWVIDRLCCFFRPYWAWFCYSICVKWMFIFDLTKCL